MQPRSECTAAEGMSPGTLGEGGEAEAGRELPSRLESELTVHFTRGMAMGASGGHGDPQLHCWASEHGGRCACPRMLGCSFQGSHQPSWRTVLTCGIRARGDSEVSGFLEKEVGIPPCPSPAPSPQSGAGSLV